ncbi:TraR/DksA C4-type zinc finger protein [Rhizobium metallidurans]|uniref:Phage/conjugal plasmid C-4 type zinc finger TraR family protein n=1 Tax=Rhizobium metallidurans TaxID=1265931 RepID=A0A7W6CR81_9HYPH|nr:TraR/DksA C4-type zinc finger protein [Rhizobium metallidurans]MBB3963502.1 phage/conjugal plasmid C-4 type zinc finger TraR family protein [Rhizobium metallidurans]
MSDEANFDLAEILADRERQTAIDLARDALKRAGKRNCEDCGGEIGAKRRQILPSATRCMPCQIAHEAMEKAR